MKPTSGAYLSRLDHLRFLAAALVFQWHFLHNTHYVPTTFVPSWPPLSLFEEGHTGVSLFLVLSGFIFMRLARGSEVSPRAFYVNRLIRILPLFAVWTFFHFLTEKVDPVKLVVSTLFLLDRKVVPGVGWTVIIEFQFYVLFPFLMLFYHRHGRRYLVALILLAVSFKALYWFQAGSVQNLAYWTMFGRIDQFLCGMLAGTLVDHPGLRRKAGSIGLLLLSVAALSLAYDRFNRMGGFYNMPNYPSKSCLWIFMPVIEGLCYAGLLLGYLGLPIAIPRPVDRLLARFGEVSYSMYWSHVFVIDVVAKLFAKHGVAPASFGAAFAAGALIALPACLAFSTATYHLIEKPFLELRRSYLRPRAVSGSAP